MSPESKEHSVIDSFSGKYDWLSNFYPVIVTINDLNFNSVEIAYQASKSNDYMDWLGFSQLPASDSGKAKRMGRKVKMIRDWDLKKISIMKRLLYQKFVYEFFRTKLLETGTAEIIEGNYWHDNYWGNCKCEKCKSKPGLNNLGKLLMEIRGNI